jgi:DNA-binding HxlR family transcriptional regulator
MQGQRRQVRRDGTWTVERAIVLQVLRDDHEERWALTELIGEVSDLSPEVVEDGLRRLEREGILERADSYVLASRAAHHLDELELISI